MVLDCVYMNFERLFCLFFPSKKNILFSFSFLFSFFLFLVFVK